MLRMKGLPPQCSKCIEFMYRYSSTLSVFVYAFDSIHYGFGSDIERFGEEEKKNTFLEKFQLIEHLKVLARVLLYAANAFNGIVCI